MGRYPLTSIYDCLNSCRPKDKLEHLMLLPWRLVLEPVRAPRVLWLLAFVSGMWPLVVSSHDHWCECFKASGVTMGPHPSTVDGISYLIELDGLYRPPIWYKGVHIADRKVVERCIILRRLEGASLGRPGIFVDVC